MTSVVEIKNKKALAPLFRENRYDTVMMNSVLEGHFGNAYADSKTNPSVARLDSGAFTILGGDPKSPAAPALLRYKPIYFTTPENNEWREALKGEFKDKLSTLPFTEFSSQSLDVNHLAKMVQQLHADFDLVKIDASLAEQLPSALNNKYFFENFKSIKDFLQRGFGYCILHGNRIVSAATSMARCNNAIDIESETASGFQRRGLGASVGAKLVFECLKNRIEPKWLAANTESEKLAQRLGYVKGDSYETYMVEQEA